MIPPEENLGPAMRELSERHRAFVMACVAQGAKVNYTLAATRAGYQGQSGAMKVQAHRLAHDERIQAAILEEAKRSMGAATLMATALLVEIVADTNADRKDRIKAAGMILDRGGIPAASERRVEVRNVMSREEKVLKIVEACRPLGINPRAFLGNLIDVREGDYKVVESIE